jgi:hypothetical protein
MGRFGFFLTRFSIFASFGRYRFTDAAEVQDRSQ